MTTQARSLPVASSAAWPKTVQQGLIYGTVTLFVTLVGLVGAFIDRNVITGVVSMGQIILFILPAIGAYMVADRTDEEAVRTSILHGTALGALTGSVMAAYVLFASAINLREILVNSTPELLETLTFGLPLGVGVLALIGAFALLGAISAALNRLPKRVRRAILIGLAWLVSVGILADLLRTLVGRDIASFFFERAGLSIPGALIVGGLVISLTYARPWIKERTEPVREWLDEPDRAPIKTGLTIALIVPAILIFPQLVGLYLSDVIANVGIYILMGLGLNIVVGFAGLLDLGYVAFFAIGAYTTALLTSPSSPLITLLGEGALMLPWSFWGALPAAMLISAMAGIMLGIPVLRMRGDYLAIVTLGFGEIIRVLATSEAMKPLMGGPSGILSVPKPSIFGFELGNSQLIYYVVVVGCLLALFVAWRLSDSRIGRAWMAMREDEDVAEAMGINLVQFKLMAFATGATLSGLAGAIFASKLGSIFPASFDLIISVNVLSLIIVGGMASLPGVFVGALILVGLPELLREFAEFRQLMYGAVLIAMMLLKPEGFWPASTREREIEGELEIPVTEEPRTDGGMNERV